MRVSLRPFAEGDRPLLDLWAQRIESKRFMSRYAPHPNQCVLWCVIQSDGNDVGTVWLESAGPGAAVLGILLGDPDLFGRGIGARAIELAVERACQAEPLTVVRLNVRSSNSRAVACYERCGFIVVASGIREGVGAPYAFLTMEKRLHSPHALAALGS